MRIQLSSITVADQQQALDFYTNVLGFRKHSDIPMGPHRWLTVVSADEGAGPMELVLEPLAFEPAKVYQKALFDAGIPATALLSSDIHAEYAALTAKGVVFRGAPVNYGPVTSCLFEDTCGNLINLAQPATPA